MCGIAGYIFSGVLDKSNLKKMTDSIIHRGPDGEGHYYGDGFFFGHRRLAIVDLTEHGKQPMLYQDRYIITFNGEIYNYIEIKKELIDVGYRFNNDTDTEVIMAAYDYWGVNCLDRFNGMWAFVLYDKKEDVFFISRDRFGKKPLYYSLDNNKFVFCSEVKGLYASGLVEKAPNKSYLKNYLENGPNEYDAETAFANVYRFPFAHYFLGSKEQLLNQPQFTRYWELTTNTSKERFCPNKAKEYAKQYYDLLADAVRLRLRADVKVGSALSGGLDSSSIVYLVNEQLRAQGKADLQETFSSVYKSDGTQNCDESVYIDLLAKALNVNSNQIEPQEGDIPVEHQKMIWAMENPPESTCMSGWHTFMKVKESGVKVTLDGQGADEQLAGYLPYIASYLTSISLIDLYKEFFYFLKIPGAKKTLLLSFLMANFKFIFGMKAYQALFKKIKGRQPPTELNLELKSAIEKGLINLIHYSDRVSMGHSIESRMPFMDYRLVEFLAQVPACYKMHNGWTKYLARLAFDKKLPDEITWRKDKMGWPIPEEHWFRGNLRLWASDTLMNSKVLKEISPELDAETEFKSNIKKSIRKLNIATINKLNFW
ncbi:asparagine synthase (glutamine-hydrolyzing) [Vibrio cholerae]|uniref:asparagine synthase (glutamine-hydrolyzing) n=1 Tax=Vibrio cholerae TaxID=666 RepID=UPI00157A2B1F|nr:asparagine synthase (glutamine-hydrolyzing) [Vibrio cholerae]EGR4050535.1 asparagine synthase (glutamine-hydrolyzing) [Vibrio cholerae]EGR4401979.1 asparagine synthase (glutamine-hydrolyzing) [Vibrio cholerae]EHE0026229.1 asparagine synthase (glutamine-hydrolyzing) [Vibrio cholerae]EHR7683323.1 asparagine synthase (glutamine-hydrolyzing) [Vibrio cholerae]EHT2843845.1 asparagine synthase (glutamine-hydrolyzing) [Vibrio cholerae]